MPNCFKFNVIDLCTNYLPSIDGYHYEFEMSEDNYGYDTADIYLVSTDDHMTYVATVSPWDPATGEVYDTSSKEWMLLCREHVGLCILDYICWQ